MKTIVLFVSLLLALLSGTVVPVLAQEGHSVSNRVELRLLYTLQRPMYGESPVSPIGLNSLLRVRKDHRLRNAAGLGLRYYATRHWFAEYQLNYSPEGGGYRQQFTNADYLKNSFLVGYSSRHSRSLIVDVFTGVEYNWRLNATAHSTFTRESTSARSFIRRSHWSLPLGIGLKTRLGNNLLVGVQSFASVSQNVSTEPTINAHQYLLPTFRVTCSTFLK